jgi:predicted small lipoprotein YifL
MRTSLGAGIAALLVCLSLAACGGTERKTVIVNPPPNSTTVVDQNGNAHVEPNR